MRFHYNANQTKSQIFKINFTINFINSFNQINLLLIRNFSIRKGSSLRDEPYPGFWRQSEVASLMSLHTVCDGAPINAKRFFWRAMP